MSHILYFCLLQFSFDSHYQMLLIKLQMKVKLDCSQDTSPNSPTRVFPQQFSSLPSSKNFVFNPSTLYSARMSDTDSEINTHELIREVVDKSRAKSIWHDISRIDKESILYSVPQQQSPQQYHFDSIPPKNWLFQSECSATIKNINEGLITEPSGKPKIDEKRRPSSAVSNIDTHNKKISVSGLVSYKFNSVMAKKSLGFNIINHEEQMLKDIKKAHQTLHCSRERTNRILERANRQKHRKSLKNQRVIMSDFETKTDSYLKHVVAQSEANTVIFGQRTKKVNCVKKYMQRQKVDYDVAMHAVNAIEATHKRESKSIPKVNAKLISDESQLNRKRTPTKHKSVLVRSYNFIEL